MPKLNENYQNVKDSYLFAEIARRVKVYEETHPEKAADIIRLGIDRSKDMHLHRKQSQIITHAMA